MALTAHEKQLLIQAYAPVLIFHPDEKFTPMRPDVYIHASSLWDEQPASDDSKKGSWGKPPGQPNVFPRQPLIPRFGISVDPGHDTEGAADPDNDGVNEWYLGHLNDHGTYPYLASDTERKVWLDFGGWEDSPEVSAASQNSHAHLAEIQRRVRDEPQLAAARDWYYADVDDLDSLQNLLLTFDLTGSDLSTLLRQLYSDLWIIWYYFFYPAHEGLLKDCEQRIDGGRDGSYEGDWSAVGVLVRRPQLLPWEHGTPFPQPERVFYSVRLRGVAKALAPDLFKQGMMVHAWEDVDKVGTHIRVFVARGTHNNYRLPGDKDLVEPTLLGIPLEKYVCGMVNIGGGVIDDVNGFIDDVGETAKDATILMGKVVAGAALGSFLPGIGQAIGALAGGVAGLAEAFSSSSDEPSRPPTTGKDHAAPLPPQQYGLVLTPPEVAQPLFTNHPEPERNEAAREVRQWQGTPAEHLVDKATQIWWPRQEDGERKGYEGAWGVRTTADSFGLRSGIPFPDFKKAVFESLIVSKSK